MILCASLQGTKAAGAQRSTTKHHTLAYVYGHMQPLVLVNAPTTQMETGLMGYVDGSELNPRVQACALRNKRLFQKEKKPWPNVCL